jgi:hypothetical protein
MEEVRQKDVLRLFFGKEHKHYLVSRVGKHNLKLKNEHGVIVSLPHNDGKIERLGDAVITGFEVLRDPNRYSHFSIGNEVSVRTHEGESFKGDILENADGLLKIKTDTGNEWYVDLDADNKVELVGNILSDESEDVKLSDEIDDLFFLKVQKETKTNRNRVYELFRTHIAEPSLPFWIVPVLDPNKCKLDVRETNSLEPDQLKSLYISGGKKSLTTRTEPVVFHPTVYGDKVKETYVYPVFPEASEKKMLPVVEYALMVPLPPYMSKTLLNPNDGFRLSNPTPETKRFDTVEGAVKAFTPNLSSVFSGFDADLLLYPLRLTFEQVVKISTAPVKKELKKTSPPNHLHKHTRSTLAAAYNGKIHEGLTPSETLARMFALDFGNLYFTKPSSFRAANDKNWAVERLGQRMKAAKNNHTPLAKEAIAIVNEMYSLFFQGKYADFLGFVQQYGRTATKEERSEYLYFSPPLYSKYVLVPCSAEHIARMCHFRGKTGVNTVVNNFVSEDGLLVDRASGFVYSLVQSVDEFKESAECNSTQQVSCFLNFEKNKEALNNGYDLQPESFSDGPRYTEDDLILLNLAQRIARELGLRLPSDAEMKLLNAVRIEGRQPYKNACTIAAFLAHHGNVGFGVAALALRKVAKRKIWADVHESKELTADVSKAASKFVSKKSKDHAATPKPSPQKNALKIRVNLSPSFEHVVSSAVSKKSTPAAPEQIWTVLPNVMPKEYHHVSDVFAPDLSAAAVLLRCTPVVMSYVAPSEKSFFDYLGGKASNLGLFEFVSNLACGIPSLLVNGRRDFQEQIFPTGKKKKEFKTAWMQYYAPFLILSVSESPNDVSSRFAMKYKEHAQTFQRLVSVAKTALMKQDEEMLQACAVRSAYLHLSDDMSDEMETYLVQMIRACVEMYRRDTGVEPSPI